MLGLYIVLTRAQGLGPRVGRAVRIFRRDHILGVLFLRQHGGSAKRLCLIGVWMIAIAVLFVDLAAALKESLLQNSLRYSPYDLMYSQIFGMNQVEDADVRAALEREGVAVAAVNQADYLRNGTFSVFSVSRVNRLFHCGYRVADGEFLPVLQYDRDDDYDHDLSAPDFLSFRCGGGGADLS